MFLTGLRNNDLFGKTFIYNGLINKKLQDDVAVGVKDNTLVAFAL